MFDFLGVRYYGKEISVVSSLAQTDALAKLLIEKGVITQDEFMEKLKAEPGRLLGTHYLWAFLLTGLPFFTRSPV